MTVGGDTTDRLMMVFDALRPDGGRRGSFIRPNPVGASHFAKMHNGIEY